MGTVEHQARRLYAKRDKLERELALIDTRLRELRAEYMKQENTYGLHPAAFRREVETRKAA